MKICIEAARRTLTLAKDEPTLLKVPTGSAIFAARGGIWLTQEGHFTDWVLEDGESFEVRDTGPILLSAIGRSAVAFVAGPVSIAEVPLLDDLKSRMAGLWCIALRAVARVTHAGDRAGLSRAGSC